MKLHSILLIVVLSASLLSSCKARTSIEISPLPEPPSSRIEPSDLPEDGENSVEAVLLENESDGSENYRGEKELTFEEKVVLVYGAEIEEDQITGTSYMRTSPAGMFFVDDWENAMDIEAGSFYAFYLSMMWKEDLSEEEKLEKYKSPYEGEQGWFFPEDLYEKTVMKYFDVTTEYLRSERLIYDEENSGYYLGSGGGIGERPIIIIESMSEDGDYWSIKLRLRSSNDPEDKGTYKLLTIKMLPDGGYMFSSCKTV